MKEKERERKMIEEQLDVLFAKARDCVEGALFPITSFALKVTDVQLISKPFHDLFREQVIDQSGLDASIVVHQLKQMLWTINFNANNIRIIVENWTELFFSRF